MFTLYQINHKKIEALLVVYYAYVVRSETENYMNIFDGLNHI